MNTGVIDPDPFDVFLDSYVQELIEMPDADILDGVDPVAVKAESLAMLDAVRKEAGCERLVSARTKLTQAQPPAGLPNVSAAEARAFLCQVANDPRYTLAARELADIPDDEAIRLYAQLRHLEADGQDDGNDKR